MLYVVVQDIHTSIKLKHILVFNDYKYVFFIELNIGYYEKVI